MRKPFLSLLVLCVAASAAWAVSPANDPVDTRGVTIQPLAAPVVQPAERGTSSRIPDGKGFPQAGSKASPMGVPEAWVDDDYTNLTPGWGTTHFDAIQDGILAVNAGGIVNVYPGTYVEAAPNSYLYDATGPYTFGLFLAVDDVTVRGVDASGTPITSYADIVATVQCNATNNFGPSGVFVEGSGVTLSGLEFFLDPAGYQNKTIEVIGDACTVKFCRLSDGNSLYVNDFRFDAGTNTSLVKSYTFEGNEFTNGTSIDLASGAGFSGPTSSRKILNNHFAMAGWYWPAISFNGSGTGVPWFVYGVGGAVITGNSFSGGDGQFIRARGTYDNSQFDWGTYFNGNTFDQAVVVGPNPPTDLREYSYTSGSYLLEHCRRIGTSIAEEIAHAAAGDIVLVGAGTYVATSQIVIDKNLTLTGAGSAATVIQAGFNTTVGGNVPSEALIYVPAGVAATIEDLAVDGTGFTVKHAIQSRGSSLTVRDCAIRDIYANSYDGRGIVFFGGTGLVENCDLSNIQRIGVHVRGNVEPVAPVVAVNGLIYTGKGVGDFLDYGVEFGGGGAGTVTGGIFTACQGVASVDGSGSAGILATDFWGTGTNAVITGATLTGNSVGVHVGYAPGDLSVVSVHGCTISGNTSHGLVTAGPAVDAADNDWGSPTGPLHTPSNPGGLGNAVTDHVSFVPWTGRTTSVTSISVAPYGPLGLEGTAAIGVDGDNAPGFGPGAFRAPAAPPYTKYGFDPEVILGRPVVVGEIHSVTYFTKKSTLHTVDPNDWYFQFYTDPYAGSPYWYGYRINSEPYFAQNLVETAGAWNQWVTSPGANNRLRFYDSSGNLYFGSYTDGFLSDLTTNPMYSAQPIMVMYLGVGSLPAPTFNGLLDGVVVELVNGETMSFNFVSGNGEATVTPATSGPINCSQSQTLTFNLIKTEGMPDVFGFNAVVRATGPVTWGPITSLAPFGGTTQFLTFNQGDGSYMISGTTVGSPTQPITALGTTPLFTVQYNATGTGTANITFDSFTLRDPNNAPIPAVATGASITIDCTSPAAVTAITAAPAHNKVNVGWTHNGADVAAYEVYRGLWHNGTPGVSAYPEYDDLPADVIPARPASRAAAAGSAEWALAGTVPVGTNAFADQWADATQRGVYYYEVFAVDAANNASAGATMTTRPRATNYWLGDVDGTAGSMVPNGLVNVFDMTVLSTHFGVTNVPLNSAASPVDVGPTHNFSRLGIPTTDSAINFEDLMVFAMNFGVVSAAKVEVPVATAVDLAWVRYDDGSLALRLVNGAGLKGLRVTADVPVASVTAGGLLDQQSELTFLRNVGEALDASVAVMGVNTTFIGSGDLLVIAAGAAITAEDLTISARAIDNSRMDVSITEAVGGEVTPRVFALNPAYPNPFNPMTKISFSLPEAQSVQLTVYGLDGRKIATLADGAFTAGLHEVVWTGRDDAGKGVASGTYIYRIDAGPYSDVRKMTLMK